MITILIDTNLVTCNKEGMAGCLSNGTAACADLGQLFVLRRSYVNNDEDSKLRLIFVARWLRTDCVDNSIQIGILYLAKSRN